MRSAHAQSHPTPARSEPAESELTVRVTLPAALTAIRDYTRIIVSSDQDKLQALAERRKRRSASPIVTFSIPLPKSVVKKLESSN